MAQVGTETPVREELLLPRVLLDWEALEQDKADPVHDLLGDGGHGLAKGIAKREVFLGHVLYGKPLGLDVLDGLVNGRDLVNVVVVVAQALGGQEN